MKLQAGLSKPMQIAHVLEREIRSGQIGKGDQLASEHELVRRFSVSRNTVRRGLEQLTRQGLITTKSGIGSFVTFSGIGSFVTYNGAAIDNALGWTLALSQAGDEIETRILSIARRPCPTTRAFLELESDDFLCVDRLRVLKNRGLGISLERSRSPWRAAFQSALDEGLLNGSLGETLAAADLVIDRGEEWADLLTDLPAADAALMAREPAEPMLRLRRATRTADGELVEFVESLLDPTRFGLHLEF